MSETLEELKAIVNNAPDGATNINDDGDYVKGSIFNEIECYCSHSGWVEIDMCDFNVMRSLSDIKSIIELMEDNNKLRQTTIKEILNKKVSMTSTGREVWIRVQDVEGMLDE